MKTTKVYCVLIILFTVLLACNNDDDSGGNNNPPVLSNEKQITGFQFNTSNNNGLVENVNSEIDQDNQSITLIVPFGTDVTSLLPTVQVSAGATYSPTGAQDFTQPVTYTVTAENETSNTYNITVNVAPSSEASISAFAFLATDNDALSDDVVATINHGTLEITAILPVGTDESVFTELIPDIEITEGASVTPEGAQDFTDSVTYTVTAEDGTTINTYTVMVYIAPSSEATLTSFVFLAADNDGLSDDVVATINQGTREITATFPEGTDESIITALIPTIEISEGATITPEGMQNFSVPVDYTVVSENEESTTVYEVIVTITPDTETPEDEITFAGETWNLFNPDVYNVVTNNATTLQLDLAQNALWFHASQGGLVYREITGDFTFTATVNTVRQSNNSQPVACSICLGGIVARNPVSASENYVHLVTGNTPDGTGVESKNTTNNSSTYTPHSGTNNATYTDGHAMHDLRIIRSGSQFSLYKRSVDDVDWVFLVTYTRNDLPETLQVGFNIYTTAASGNPVVDLSAIYSNVSINQ